MRTSLLPADSTRRMPSPAHTLSGRSSTFDTVHATSSSAMDARRALHSGCLSGSQQHVTPFMSRPLELFCDPMSRTYGRKYSLRSPVWQRAAGQTDSARGSLVRRTPDPWIVTQTCGLLRLAEPYSDLLLHHRSSTLADTVIQGAINSGPDLLHDPFSLPVSRVRYLHDGRVCSIFEAILWHDGDAQPARSKLEALLPDQRNDVLTTLTL